MLAQGGCIAYICSLYFGSVLPQMAVLKSASGKHVQRKRRRDCLDDIVVSHIKQEILGHLLELLVHVCRKLSSSALTDGGTFRALDNHLR